VAEVQSVENAPQLHTRSLRYGKVLLLSNFGSLDQTVTDISFCKPTKQLRNGLLLTVPPSLIRRLKSHFHTLPPPCGPLGVDVIMGVNGYIWVSVSVGERNNAAVEGFVDAEGVYSDVNDVSIPFEAL
jgi:exosome complex RNA-binding protein Rrp4